MQSRGPIKMALSNDYVIPAPEPVPIAIRLDRGREAPGLPDLSSVQTVQ